MGGFRGQKLTNGGNLPNGWTDWHHIWHTYADSSETENEHRLKNNYPLKSPGSILFMWSKTQAWEMWSNGWLAGCCF